MPPRKRAAKPDPATDDGAAPAKRPKRTTTAIRQPDGEDAQKGSVSNEPVQQDTNTNLTVPSDTTSTKTAAAASSRSEGQEDIHSSVANGNGNAPQLPQGEEEDEGVDDELEHTRVGHPQRASDLYLDTINRAVLDFDFEKVCSVSLSNINIYGCLVCGKYFQGRSKRTPAYAHSIHDDHHVFINLETCQVYVLPDGYNVSDPSLDDIARVLSPTFTPSLVSSLSRPQVSFDLSKTPYMPGYIGLNNIKANDYLNVIIHALLHVPLIRDPLLLSTYTGKESELVKRFASLAKKVWNGRLFKAQVSPHDFLQEVGRVSAGKFVMTQQGDPIEFLGWILNTLHRDLGGGKKRDSSAIYRAFQGELRLETQAVIVKDELSGHVDNVRPEFDISREIKTTKSPFLFLALDLPPVPLFQDAIEGKNIVPQVSIYSVLAKYDGVTSQEAVGQVKRYKCQRLPPYIILHYKRFTKNFFVEEKNPTIINFPLNGLDFKDFVDLPPGTSTSTSYDLLANITHESTAGTTRDKANTAWKVTLRAPPAVSNTTTSSDQPPQEDDNTGEDQWISIQDLIVEKVQKEIIFLGETVLQIWERRDEKEKREARARATSTSGSPSKRDRMDVD